MAASLILATLALGGAAALVGHRAAAREAAAEAAFPPTGQLLRVNGATVHAHVEGSGPDLILLHGASGNTRDFTFSLLAHLAPHYRVIAFDRPGLGWSDSLGDKGLDPAVQAAVLHAAARQLGVQRPIVLGHSYGGAVALAWGLQDQHDLGALVILSGATMPWSGGLGPWYAITSSRLGAAVAIPLVTAFAGAERTKATIAGIFAPDAAPPGYAQAVGAGLTLRRATLRMNARQVNSLNPYLRIMAPEYPRLTLPVEIVHGDADSI
ncbi:MAG TPA: alpha/beta hydrolase, partial [Paracoccaceae bacterium]